MTEKAHPRHAPASSRGLRFDPAEFLHFLDGTGWSERQKEAYAREVWNLVVPFVDFGFGIHPVQLVGKNANALELDSLDVLALKDNSDNETDQAVALHREAAGGSDS